MNRINERQSKPNTIKIAAAFRQVYKLAKFWKSFIWGLTIILVIGQLLLTTQIIKTNLLPVNLTSATIVLSLLLLLFNTFGHYYIIMPLLALGARLNRLHDITVLGIGVKSSLFEIMPSQIEKYSRQWLSKHPDDYSNLEEWWPNAVSKLPEALGICLCLLSTFKWETELRKKYRIFVGISILIVLGSGFLIMYLMNYLLTDYIIKIFVPTFPLIELLTKELMSNNLSIQTSNFAKQRVSKLWEELITKPNENHEASETFKELVFLWDSYRASTLPIFDWLYWLTQQTMNYAMIIDVNYCVGKYLIDSKNMD